MVTLYIECTGNDDYWLHYTKPEWEEEGEEWSSSSFLSIPAKVVKSLGILLPTKGQVVEVQVDVKHKALFNKPEDTDEQKG